MADCSYTRTVKVNLAPSTEITDRAKRYRAQKNVEGPKVCAICRGNGRAAGAGGLQVLHLSGDESDGDKKNLAWGCRSCNAKLAAAWKWIGSKVRTAQYNPGPAALERWQWNVDQSGNVGLGRKVNPSKSPSFEQYAWAVAHHARGAYDDGGAVIHATPKAKRIQYAKTIADLKSSRGSHRQSEVPF